MPQADQCKSPFVVAPEWLFANLHAPNTRIIDGSWYLDASRNPHVEYQEKHIEGAIFFDLDKIAASSSELPHMLPPANQFADQVGKLGISNTDTIIVYDGDGLFSAARVWWTFRAMGADNVLILDGGLPAWIEAGYPVTSESTFVDQSTFMAHLNGDAVASLTDMTAAITDAQVMVLDARPADRFSGHAPEPRAGLRSGHMPGSLNLPSAQLVMDGHLLGTKQLQDTFASLHPALNKKDNSKASPQIITSCGSGVTAAILSLGLASIGYQNTRLYDGSWAEWGSKPDTAIAKG